MYRSTIVFVFFFLILILGGCINNESKPNSIHKESLNSEELFIEWAKKVAIPFDIKNQKIPDSVLQKIGADIANSSVVILSEGFHNCEEMLGLQAQLIPYLIKEKGFNTIVTESGLPESKYINDYIHGKDSIPNMWDNSINDMYSQWETGRKTIQSLLEHNQSNDRQVDYIGADIGGFYNNWDFPFQQIFSYLDSVDVPVSKTLKQELSPYFEVMTLYAAYHYTIKLTAEQRNRLVIILEELVHSFKENRENYISKSNKKDYQWILQCVKSMQMAENYYRNYNDAKDTTSFRKYVGLNGREVAMAENIKWILATKEKAKIIVINHVIHTKTESQYQDELYGNFTPMGQLLKQAIKDDLYIIGMVYGGGQFWNKWQVHSRRVVDTIPTPPSGSIEGVMQAIFASNYYLRWENPPTATHSWFKEDITLRENDYTIQIKPSEWNACFYLQEVSPAKPFE